MGEVKVTPSAQPVQFTCSVQWTETHMVEADGKSYILATASDPITTKELCVRGHDGQPQTFRRLFQDLNGAVTKMDDDKELLLVVRGKIALSESSH